MRMLAVTALVVITFASQSLAQATAPAATAPADPAAAQVDSLRDQLKAAYQRGDVDGMLKYLHPQVVITFPDGDVLRGREALAKYYHDMLKAPGHIVESYSSDPVVTERAIHGDAVVSFGRMNDNYVLTDGKKFGLDSRFTVTALRVADGPSETGGWVIRSFHSSTNAFDNPILGIAIRKTMWMAGAAALVLGALLGTIVGVLIGKRRRSLP